MQTLDRPLSSVFIVPLVEFMVAVCLFIALLYDQRELTLLGLLVLGITIGARLWSRLSLLKIRSSAAVDKPRLFPDESFVLRVGVANAKFLPVWLQMNVPFEDAFDPASGEMRFSGECGLLWYQQVSFTRELIARHRGVYRLGPAWMRVGDLFGFFSRQKRTAEDIQVIVYPRLVPLKPLLLPSRDFFGLPGAKTPIQDPIYILGTRDYQHGRPARHIHWKASARHNRLQEKVFEPSEQKKILLSLEVSEFEKARASEDFERTLEVVGSLAVQFDQSGYALGFLTNGVVDEGPSILPMGRGPQQLPSILEILARLKMRANGKLIDMIRRAPETPWGASCVHFTGEPDEETQAMVHYLSHRNIPLIIVMCVPDRPSEENGHRHGATIYRLEDLRAEAAGKS